jgi:phosphoglycerate dehydrogenase-like enzyme
MPAVDGRDVVLVTWMRFDPDDHRTGGRLRAAGLALRHAPKLGARTHEEVAELAADAVAAIVSTDPFDARVFAAAPRLRVVARVGVGTDSIALHAATDAGVVVTITPGANHETAADHAVALILAALRRLLEHDASVRRGEWSRGAELTPWDAHRATVGLVGYGAIGRAVARRLRGFEARLLVADPAVTAAAGAELVPLDELLGRADVISLHLPLTDATRGMIGAEEIAAMRPEAILVNTARGGLVDEPALAAALREGRLRGAALDVFADEPHVGDDLAALPNVILTPHIGGLSEGSMARMTEQASDCVLAALAGAPDPRTVANPDVLERHAAEARA